MRVLPAYRMFRACKRQGGQLFDMRFRLAAQPSSAAASWPAAHAAAGSEQVGAQQRLQTFTFAPVETPTGSLCMGVAYQPASMVQVLEVRALPAGTGTGPA